MRAMWETLILSLGREDLLEEGYGYPLQDSCLETAMSKGAQQATYSPWGLEELDPTEGLSVLGKVLKRGVQALCYLFIFYVYLQCQEGTNNTDLKIKEK